MGRKRQYAPELKGRISEVDDSELLWSGEHVALYTRLERDWCQLALRRIGLLERAGRIDAKQRQSLTRIVCAVPFHRERGYLVDGFPVFSFSQRQLAEDTGLDKDTAARAVNTLRARTPEAAASLVILSEQKGRATKYGCAQGCPLLLSLPAFGVSPLRDGVSPLRDGVSPLRDEVSPQAQGYGDGSLLNLYTYYLEEAGGEEHGGEQ